MTRDTYNGVTFVTNGEGDNAPTEAYAYGDLDDPNVSCSIIEYIWGEHRAGSTAEFYGSGLNETVYYKSIDTLESLQSYIR